VRLLRHQIAAEVEDGVIHFTDPAGPCQLSVVPNGSPLAPLHVFINPPADVP